MNPPGDADTDGSPSNCTAFFISTVHDLSLNETHAPRSPPPHTSHFLYPSPSFPSFPAPLSSLPVQLSLSSHFSVPLLSFSVQLALFFIPLYLCFYPCLCVCLCVSLCCCCCCSEHTPQSPFPHWFSLQCRCAPGQWWPGWETTEVTLRLGDGSLDVTDSQSYSDEPSTAYLQGRQRGEREKMENKGNKKMQQHFADNCYNLSTWINSIRLSFTEPHIYFNKWLGVTTIN